MAYDDETEWASGGAKTKVEGILINNKKKGFGQVINA